MSQEHEVAERKTILLGQARQVLKRARVSCSNLRPRLWAALALFAILCGAFLARSNAVYLADEEPVEWGSARWLGPQKETPVAYYRLEFPLDAPPARAFLQLAAPDSFSVYVNGRIVASGTFASVTTGDFADITGYLKPGRNVVAVRVERMTYPGTARLLARLVVRDPTGLVREIRGNKSWRVSPREERQRGGGLPWYESEFDDAEWSVATNLAGPPGEIHWAHPWANRALMDNFPRGEWVWSERSLSPAVTFRRDFKLGGGRVVHAWLGVAINCPYTISINGARVPAADDTAQFMDIYDIGPFLSAGDNRIEIDTSSFGPGSRLAVAGQLLVPGRSLDISSDGQWLARGDDGAWRRVERFGSLSAFPYVDPDTSSVFATPVLRLRDLKLPGGLLVRLALGALPWIAVIAALSLVGVMASLRLMRPSPRDLDAAALPWILASLLLATAFMLPFDVRITEAEVFTFPAAMVVLAAGSGWFWLILVEGRRESA